LPQNRVLIFLKMMIAYKVKGMLLLFFKLAGATKEVFKLDHCYCLNPKCFLKAICYRLGCWLMGLGELIGS
jgi:hypothetical protein